MIFLCNWVKMLGSPIFESAAAHGESAISVSFQCVYISVNNTQIKYVHHENPNHALGCLKFVHCYPLKPTGIVQTLKTNKQQLFLLVYVILPKMVLIVITF